jgi:hypothetical protein
MSESGVTVISGGSMPSPSKSMTTAELFGSLLEKESEPE